MTSLAQQLQRLAVPHTQLVLTTDKKRVSFLFDPKEAANLDRETVYALGISGLEELENVDPAFAEYETSLFNKSSQTWSRSLQSQEVNDQLDATIGKFLIRLSPYLLLKCTHKVLEWLVFRYQIEQHNTDDLLLCFLPYHDTRVFVRVLQLLKLDQPTNKWNWLHPAAKSGVPLAKKTFINHCKKDPGFLTLITQLVPRFIKVHGPESLQLRAVVSLYAGALLGVAEHREDITERVMSIIVPSLIVGFKSKCVDFKAAAYMVLCQIAVKTQVKESVLKQMIPALCKRIIPRVSQEALMCLTVVYKTQNVTTMSKRTFKHICRIPGLIQLLSYLAKQCDISTILHAWFERLLPVALTTSPATSGTSSDGSTDDLEVTLPEYDRLLVAAILDIRLEKTVSGFVAKSLIQQLLSRRQDIGGSRMDVDEDDDDDDDEDDDGISLWRQQTKELLTALERKYPDAFDAAVEQTLAEYMGQTEALDLLQEMMSLTNSPIKHQVMSESSTSLLLGLNHSRAAQRVLAVRQLAGYVHKITETNKKDDFVQEMLLQRLRDDSAEVVLAVLNLGAELSEAVNKETLVACLLDIVNKHQGSGAKGSWRTVVSQCLQLLCSSDLDLAYPDLTLTLLPHLLASCQEAVQSADILLRSKVMQKDALLGNLCKDYIQAAKKHDESWLSEGGCLQWLESNAADHITSALASCPLAVYQHTVDFLMKQATKSSRPMLEFALLFKIMKGLLSHVDKGKPRKAPRREKLEMCRRMFGLVQSLPQSRDPAFLSLVEKMMETILQALRQHPAPEGAWLDASNEYVSLLLEITDLLLKESSRSHEQWRTLLMDFTKGLESSVSARLLSLLWSPGGASSVNVISHVGSYHLACYVWKDVERGEMEEKMPKLESTVFLSLLISLASPHQAVRRGALRCFGMLKTKWRSRAGCHGYLLKKIVKHREEILTDEDHVLRTLSIVYNLTNTQNTEVLERKQVSLTSLLQWITGTETPSGVCEQLLHVMRDVPHEPMLEKVVPLAQSILRRIKDDPSTVTSVDLDIVQHVIRRYDDQSSPEMKASDASWELLTTALAADKRTVGRKTPQVMAIEQISREMFSCLPELDLQCRLVCCLVDAGVKTQDPDVANLVQKTLKQLKLQGFHVEHELKVSTSTQQMATVKGQKRTRTRKDSAPINYKRVILVLEVMQARKKVKDSSDLAALLFSLLERLQTEESEDTEYCKQIVLTCIHNLSSKWTEETKPEGQESFNVEVLVQCIRNSPSPQTQQQALLVMATIAHLFPEYILHNVISVFTFMGSSLLQQDDSHTFQIITRTIQTVIPALMKAHKDEQEPLDELIGNIFRVFVDARHHIPRHRSQVLFRQLVQTVGAQRHLWSLLVLLIEKGVVSKDVPSVQDVTDTLQEQQGASSLDKDIEFAVNICDQLDASVQVTTCSRIVMFLNQMTQLHDGQVTTGGRRLTKKKKLLPPVSVDSLGPQQLRLLQYHGTRLITAVLAREGFVSQVVSQSDRAGLDEVMATDFGAFLKETLGYMSEVARKSGLPASAGAGKFWKALLHKIYDILEKVNYLLPSRVFLEVSTSLMAHEVPSVRKKSLELLNLKLQQLQLATVDDREVVSLLPVVDKLVSLVRLDKEGSGWADADISSIQQMALLGLKLLCKLLGSQKPVAFKDVFSVTIALLQKKNTPPPVLGSSLLCLAELCSSLKAHAIPHLAAFMKPLLKVLRNTTLLTSNELLLTCGLTALQRVVTSLPHFLSQYLLDILIVVSQISCVVNVEDASKKSQPAIRLKAVRHQLATVVAPRVLLPAVSDCYDKLLEQNQHALPAILSILSQHVESITSEDLSAHQTVLLTFFCRALDLRNQELVLTAKETETVEGDVIQALLAMVVRLSENSFRPMFYKLYDWACREDSPESRVRRLTLFRLCEQLSEKLRSLFNLFVGHILKAACSLLDANNTMKGEVEYYDAQEGAEAMSCQLLTYIMGCLYKCMLYDMDGFVNKELFTLILQPLVDQLENFLGEESAYEARVSDHVTACISQLAVASRDDSSWKSLNYQVLLKTRHSNAKVRYAALQAVEALAEKLGEECMVLLPETIPFLAELMEDETEEVEQKCQQVVSSLEKILGESLQKYF